mgnify:CR=1 FL=1
MMINKIDILKTLGSTIAWLIALSIFAYPTLIEAAFNTTKDFRMVYSANQGSWVAIFSNLGFLALAVFDYFLGKRLGLNKFVLWIIVFSMVFIALIGCVSCLTMNDKIHTYLILSYKNFCFIIHGLFLLCLAIIKFLTLWETIVVDKDVKGINH